MNPASNYARDERDKEEILQEIEGPTEDTDQRRESVATPPMPPTFPEMTVEELKRVLSLTIKGDADTAIVVFLCELSAFTSDSQFNISFNAPSSTGKSYIPLQIAELFPPEDVIKIGNASPTAFYHLQGVFDEGTQTNVVNLERKIIIFKDQQNHELLEELRSFLSHDEKETISLKTDRTKSGRNRTKKTILIGYPSVIFCTAQLTMGDQENTRVFLLSPETTQEKFNAAIKAKIRWKSKKRAHQIELASNADRQMLITRIRAIRDAKIDDVEIPEPFQKQLEQQFLSRPLKPRDMRDVERLIDIVKTLALLNWQHRERDGSVITANEKDVREALALWQSFAESQESGLPPYAIQVYKEVIWAAYTAEKATIPDTVGIRRQEVATKYYTVYDRLLQDMELKQVLMALENAGWVALEKDRGDARYTLVRPLKEVKGLAELAEEIL